MREKCPGSLNFHSDSGSQGGPQVYAGECCLSFLGWSGHSGPRLVGLTVGPPSPPARGPRGPFPEVQLPTPLATVCLLCLSELSHFPKVPPPSLYIISALDLCPELWAQDSLLTGPPSAGAKFLLCGYPPCGPFAWGDITEYCDLFSVPGSSRFFLCIFNFYF